MHVCMYVRMYVCVMYVCINEYLYVINGGKYAVFVFVLMYVYMYVLCVYAFTYVYIGVRTHACMYV